MEERVDRQVRTIGKKAQQKISNASVLLVNLGGIGIEIAKNLILTGFKTIGIHDRKTVDFFDLSTVFFCSEDDIGKRTRLEASLKDLRSLNPTCEIVDESASETISEELIKRYDCVIFTDTPLSSLLELNETCRRNGVKFIAGETRGLFGSVFVDLGDEFECWDTSGEKEAQGTIAGISVNEQGEAIVDTKNEQSPEIHNLSVNDVIKLVNVEGFEELNGQERKIIHRLDALTYNIGKVENVKGKYVSGGRFIQVKQKEILKFAPLREALEAYKTGDGFLLYDWAKMSHPKRVLYAFTLLWKFMDDQKAVPRSYNEEDFQKMLSFCEEGAEKEDFYSEEILRAMAFTARGNTSPMATFIGGMVSQEAQKAVTGKFRPIARWFTFEAMDCLAEKWNEDVKESEYVAQDCRYDAQIAIFGNRFQKKLGDLKYFLVGVGALGCEYLKAYALTGVCCGAKGKFSITDLDEIETSNLSRQFLFRDEHVGRMKSECAAETTKKMNPQMKIHAMTDRVGPETEDIFNDVFWGRLDGVMNALDNLHARRYVDSKCVFYLKPLFESGTLGPKAHSQVIIPKVTINYSAQRDQQTNEFPECTIHVHPSHGQHTISWAKRLFNQTFLASVQEVNMYLRDPKEYVKQNGMSVMAMETCFNYLLRDRPKDYTHCVHLARVKFERYFNHGILNILATHPRDKKTKSGAPFWSGNKRCPDPVEKFDPEDPAHRAFVESYSDLLAIFYKIPKDENVDVLKICEGVDIPEYVAAPLPDDEEEEKKEKTEEEMEEEEKRVLAEIEAQREYLAGIIKDLGEQEFDFSFDALEFEKDDALHLKFVTCASNLRSRSYKIPELQEYEVKGIAGNIIPAMITTTAIATGLTMLELIKYHQGRGIESFRNGFLNIGIPVILLNMPMQAPKNVLGKYTVWDRVFIKKTKDITLGKVIELLEERDGINVKTVAYGGDLILQPKLGEKQIEFRKMQGLKKLTEAIVGEKIKKKFMEFTVSGEIDGKIIDEYLPVIYTIEKKINKKLLLLKKRKAMLKKKREGK